MPTIRLVPSTIYNAAGSNYLSITNAANAYHDTDNTTYATIQNTNASTSNRYIYVRGFNFDSIPANAAVTGFTVKIKGYYRSGYSASLYLCNGTTTQSGATASSFGTSVATRTFSNGSLTWATIKGWGSNFGIRINCRRSSRNTAATYYIYGAEIEVTYTVPEPDPPVITVGTPSRTRISAISNYDQCVCTFTSDLALSQWEARATKAGVTPARGVGLLVESGGALAANTPATVYVENEELTQGDGEYTITVYGLSTGGIWSA